MKYAIPEVNIEGLEKKLVRIGKKCKKYGCEFKYERLGEHFEERTVDRYDDFGGVVGTRKEVIKCIDIEVEGLTKINGWQFVASLDYTDAGNIIRGIGTVEVPERYYSCKPWCEHCKTARDRKKSYIVYNGTEFKQVGKACLKDFTGGLSAEAAAAFESAMKDIEIASDFSGSSWYGPHYFDVEKFMICAAEAIRLYGYVKRDRDNYCTADRAIDLYDFVCGYKMGRSARVEAEKAVERGFDVENTGSIELVKKTREWIIGNEKDDNYFHNLKVACSQQYTEGRTLGLLVSAFPTYNRELEYAAEKLKREQREAEARAKSSWMGNVKEKVSFKVADFRVISSWETTFGVTFVYKFVSESGQEATWKTGNCIDGSNIIGSTVKGTIKELKEYREIKQTELTRCKIDYVEQEHEPWNDDADKAIAAFLEYCNG